MNGCPCRTYCYSASLVSYYNLCYNDSMDWRKLPRPYRKIGLISNCLNCGKEIYVIPSVTKKGKGKFCSKQCSNSFNSKARIGKPNPQARINVLKAHEARRGKSSWNRKDKITLTCQFCGQTYQVHECEVKRSRFCSRECSHRYKATIIGTSHPLWRRLLRKCEWCGKEVWVKPAKLAEFRFCSRQCLGAWVSSHCHSPTKPEIAISEILSSLNIPFETEYQIGKYACDFALQQYRIIIEADGDYWHTLPKRKRLDKIKDAYLKEQGWIVIRLKEKDIHNHLEACLIKISKHISLLPR